MTVGDRLIIKSMRESFTFCNKSGDYAPTWCYLLVISGLSTVSSFLLVAHFSTMSSLG